MIQGFRRDKNLHKTTPHDVKKHPIRRRTMTVVRSIFCTGISYAKKSGDGGNDGETTPAAGQQEAARSPPGIRCHGVVGNDSARHAGTRKTPQSSHRAGARNSTGCSRIDSSNQLSRRHRSSTVGRSTYQQSLITADAVRPVRRPNGTPVRRASASLNRA
ncbi:hypothetical protein JYB32_29940 [Burkholderia cenocepacia]|uniref:hypothetical protein n=1 Tax=Burkholderia cenocepacia TaxID=95486 RepID=UPI00196A348E|nr:hypothetical protein [Burkholderia cenocepacia]MBN3533574.1 hypothetical protein [Burkholderia cenocepacia]